VITHDGILHPFSLEPHRHPCLHLFHDDSSDMEGNSEIVSVNPELPPVWARIHGTSLMDNCLAGKPISNKYFDIINDHIDLL